MYFALGDVMNINLREIDGDLQNDFNTMNEVKIIKTKIDGKVRMFLLMYNEVTDCKSLIMAQGGVYKEDELIITDEIDDRLYTLHGEIEVHNYDSTKSVFTVIADRCKFAEMPLLDSEIAMSHFKITQFVSCLEILKDDKGRFLRIK